MLSNEQRLGITALAASTASDTKALSPQPVLILFGPTASGKTDILLELFGSKEFSGDLNNLQAEIISADSMQVYRGMDIGTAKPSAEERERLPHHLIDICDPRQQFNAGDFVRLADEACLQIAGRGKLPVISGGTGFYLKNFILGLSEAPPSDAGIRAAIKQELKEKGALSLMEELAAGDPISAGRIHLNDEYRLMRALEVLRSCGRPLSSFAAPVIGRQTDAAACSVATSCVQQRPDYRFIIIGLSCPREELYRRINERCAQMFRQGLAAEVRCLYEKGCTPDDPGLRAIGYREFFIEADNEPACAGERATKRRKWQFSHDIEGVQTLVSQNSRRYAKRQITFFAGIPDVKWIECGENERQTAGRVKDVLAPLL